MATASAVSTGQVTITCAKPDGTERTFPVGWDNSNQYFAGKGDIARLFCEGGHAGEYRTFISTTVSDLSLRYYQGVVPIQDTQTAIVETRTVVDSPTVVTVPDTPTVVQDTQTSTVDSPTVVQPDTSTVSVPQETLTVVDTLTSESSTPTSQTETTTSGIETPLPTPPPAVEPQPVPQPVPPAPQPEPQPQPEPVPSVEPTPVEPPLVEPTEPEPVVEEQVPVDEPSEPPVEEDTNETPVEDVTQEQTEPTPEPSPLPTVEPEPTSQPDTAPEPPIVEPSVPQVIEVGSVDLSTLAPDTPVELENGVVLTAEVVIALQLLENPAELLGQLFSDPGQVLTAISNIGADMSPEVREKSEKIVVSAIIAGGIATQAAGLAASATYRRNA